MLQTIRYAVVALLIGALVANPAWAFYGYNTFSSSGVDCGCYQPEPPCCSDCCSACEPACDSSPCAGESAAEPACCGATVMEEPQPAEARPRKALSKPTMPADPSPANLPEPRAEEMAPPTPPVTPAQPAPQPAAPAAEPAEQPATAPPVTEPTAPSMEEEPAPLETPPPSEPTETDDLFGEPSPAPESTPPADEPETEEPAAEEPPAEESETEEAPPADEEDPLEDFFNAVPRPSTLQVAGGLESKSLRTWVDNSGKYRCEARLLSADPQEIVLLKSSGEQKHVSLQRLSNADLEFVHAQVVAKREMLAKRTADERLASH